MIVARRDDSDRVKIAALVPDGGLIAGGGSAAPLVGHGTYVRCASQRTRNTARVAARAGGEEAEVQKEEKESEKLKERERERE